MSDPFVGEIRMFAGNFAPRGWAFCDGQLLEVSQNDALFSLLGTIYGGDGRTTFGLPDLRGRLPVHQGNGPGLINRSIGAKSGAEWVSLATSQVATHSHELRVSNVAGELNDAGRSWGRPFAFLASSPNVRLFRPQETSTSLSSDAIGLFDGSGQSHANVMPYLCVNFIIALFGIFPSRS